MTAGGIRVALGRERHVDTLDIDGRTEQHVEDCRCTINTTWWPCREVQSWPLPSST